MTKEERLHHEAAADDLHRCITCPLDDDRSLLAIRLALQRGPDLNLVEPVVAPNPAEMWPGTDVPRDQPVWPGVGYSVGPIDWTDMNANTARASAASINMIKRRREGTDVTVFKGLSRKADELNSSQLPPAMMKIAKGRQRF